MSETNSLERMLAVLNLFDEERPEWTPDELIGHLRYSRPTLYRYLKTLKDAGLVVSTNQSYTLGPKVVEMDFLLRKADPLVVEGQPLLEALARRHPGTAFLSRWYRDRVLCVASVRTSEDAVSSYPRGRPMPVGRGATSHAILGFLPRRQVLPLIDSRLEDFRQIGFGANREEVLARFRAIRRAGYAIARGEVTPGVVGMAAPVFDAGSAPIASLSLTMAARHADSCDLPGLGRELAEAAAVLSERLSTSRLLQAAE